MDTLERVVVLIDADNTQLKKLESVLQDISTHGRIVVKRAYGNWKKETLKNWEDEIKRLAIKAEQQFDYITGKNATDMALVIDAIELLYSKIYDGFVIVSSDSDYTPLSIKLHESGIYVIGVGEHKTPESFRNSCDEFVFLENLDDGGAAPADAGNAAADASAGSAATKKAAAASNTADGAGGKDKASDKEIQIVHTLLRKAWETYQDDDEYVNVSSAGTYIKRIKPDFDVRSYGYSKLSKLIAAYPKMYDKKRYNGKGTSTIFAYKCK